jgi:ribose transport system substrate-binding protein
MPGAPAGRAHFPATPHQVFSLPFCEMRGSIMLRNRKIATIAALAAATLTLATACSKSATGSSSASSPAAAPKITLQGSTAFNDANLGKLRDALKQAMAGKSLSGVNIAMVVNVAADYWNAGRIGFLQGCSELGIPTSRCTFYAPPDGKLTQQLSELETLRSQGITGFTVSAIDPTAITAPIHNAVTHGVNVIAIDSPLPNTDASSLYLGTPNTQAGYQAGLAMKQVLGGKGKVVVLVGSLTAANATQRIAGFEQAIAGTHITIVQKINDNLSAATAQSDAEAALSNNPDVNGLYGVYSYDGPALAQAVQSAGKTGKVEVVCDDSDTQTLNFINQGVIAGTVVQQPWQQGYMGAYLLAAEHVLGKAQTMSIVKSYLESDGSTLSSGVGLVTSADMSAYKQLLVKLGIS